METSYAFGKGRKAKPLWICAVAALFGVVWQERNLLILEEKTADNIEELWYRIRLLASLWASVSKEFQNSTFSFIHLSWESVLR